MRRVVFVLMACASVLMARETLSVLYFDNTAKNNSYNWLSKGIADMLITDLSGKISMDIVERQELQKVMKEQELSLTGAVDTAKAIAIGKLLAATRLLYGSYIIEGRTVRIDAKLTDSTTGKILRTFSVSGETSKVLVVQHELFLSITSVLVGKTVNVVVVDRPLTAVRLYYEGLDLLDRRLVTEARAKFIESSSIDPYYLKPQQGIEESYIFLKDFKRARFQRELIEAYDKVSRLDDRLRTSSWRTFASVSADSTFIALKARDK
ncbi:MAG: CsgG/HfaB family protein [Spirochaetota bacterium]